MHALTRCVMDMRNGWECFVMDAWGGIVVRRDEQMCIVTIRPLVSAALCSARCVTGHQAFPPRAVHSRGGDERGMHVYVREGRRGRLLPPRSPACSQLANPRMCAPPRRTVGP